MRILHLLFEKSWRGGEQQVAYLIQQGANRGIQSFVICRRESAFEQYCINNEINHLALPFRSQFDVLTAWQIKQYCKKNSIDLIHLHTATAHGIGILAYLLGNKIPMVLSRRVIFPIKKNKLAQFKYNHPSIKKIICVSNAVKEIVQEAIQEPNRCITIYDGIDLNKFKVPSTNYLRNKYKLAADTLIIGNISALSEDKGLYTFIDAAKILLKQKLNAKFFIIGKGNLQDSLQNYIQQNHLSEFVFLTGFLENIPAIIPELDVFVMTSEQEGLGSSLLDAIACNLPIVATAAGGIPEIIINEQTGLLAPIADAKIIAEKINHLIANPELKAKLTTQAKQHLLAHFTQEKMAENTIAIYQSLLL